MVLYNESVKIHLKNRRQHTPPMNIVQFKMKLVEDLVVGRSIANLFENGRTAVEQQHTPHTPVRKMWSSIVFDWQREGGGRLCHNSS
jgi:hypothetical protein